VKASRFRAPEDLAWVDRGWTLRPCANAASAAWLSGRFCTGCSEAAAAPGAGLTA
jgi:hypothetical protein